MHAAGNTRRLIASAAMGIVIAGCGGGGAALDAGGTTGPGDGTETPPTTTPPVSSATTVTTPNETFSPRVINIASGSSVTWQFSGARHNVTFGSLKPTGGDVPDTDAGSAATRAFATAGTYDYQCTRHSGMTGQVIVGGGGSVSPPPANPPANPGSVVQATPRAFSPERLEIAPGGTVIWEFSGGTFGIVFDEDAPDGGNIPETSAGSKVSRTFNVEGDYDYYSSKNRDVKGRIRVR